MKTLKLTTPYMSTPEVPHIQRAVGVKIDGEYGPLTATAVYEKKWRMGYPMGHVNRRVTASDYMYLRGAWEQTRAMKLREKSRKRRFPERFSTTGAPNVQHAGLTIAKGFVGQTEGDGDNEVTKLVLLARSLGVDPEIAKMGFAWCDYFVHLCALKAGAKAEAIVKGMKTGKPWPLYVPWTWRYAKDGQYGLRAVSWADARPGDFVVFNFDGGEEDHIGFLDYKMDSQSIKTVEGNTSFGPGGSQSNGGAVASRTRYRHEVVGFIRWS